MVAHVALHLTEDISVDQWGYALLNFAPELVYVVGDNFEPLRGRMLEAATLVPDLDSIESDFTRVLMQSVTGRNIRGHTSLAQFSHPHDVLYIFGPDSGHLPGNTKLDHSVFIDTDSDDGMWSWMAYSVTMWDRRNG